MLFVRIVVEEEVVAVRSDTVPTKPATSCSRSSCHKQPPNRTVGRYALDIVLLQNIHLDVSQVSYRIELCARVFIAFIADVS